MASFDVCINQALKSGKITKDVADRLLASEDIDGEISGIVANLSRQKRETAIAATRLSKAWSNISSHEKGEYDGLLSLMASDRTNKSGYGNVEKLQSFYEGKYHADVADMLQAFRTRKLGWSQDEEGLRKLVKSIYGEKVNDPQIENFAKQWHVLNEKMRNDFNAKGGSISKNEKYLMPQNHDARAIEKVGIDKWKQSILPKLDRTQMLDDEGKALSDKQLDQALDYVYETITSRGLNKTQDFSVPRLGKKLSKKHSERRFLYFKDADSWLEYQKDFGQGDVWGTLTGHIQSMSHDIGLMEVMGPSPQSTFDALLSQVDKKNKLDGRKKWYLKSVYNNVSGKTNAGDLTTAADVLNTTKNVIVASTLGRAFLSAFSDIGFQSITSVYNNVPAFKVLRRQMQLMTNEQQQVFAVKMGLTAEAMIGRLHAANRFADTYGTGASAKVAEGVMRGSLLAPWTDAGRKAFGMEFSSMLADNFKKSFSDLDQNVLRAFKTYGIEESDWNVFRKSKPLENGGAKFADLTQEGGKKFHQMIMSETDYAVPTPDAKVRAITNGGLGRATIEGQAWRASMMFKSFPATIIMTHFYRAAYQSTTIGKLSYLGAMLATTTVLGGLAVQMKDIAAGRDPREVFGDDKGILPGVRDDFFFAALVQGGGLSILGDFAFSDQNRFGGGLAQTLGGPMVEAADNLVKFTLGNVQEAATGKETNIAGETVKLANRYTPDVWQTTLVSNAAFDWLEQLADPEAEKKFNRVVRKRRKEYDQEYWWAPGELLPNRAPDLGAAVGE
jgi:hypothetical protein